MKLATCQPLPSWSPTALLPTPCHPSIVPSAGAQQARASKHLPGPPLALPPHPSLQPSALTALIEQGRAFIPFQAQSPWMGSSTAL